MERFFYINPESGEVFEYESVEHRESAGSKNLVKMTTSEIKAHLLPPPLTVEQIKGLRAAAYADPVNGSDRIFAEATRMQLMGESGWEEVRDKGVARYQEIQLQYPLPEEL